MPASLNPATSPTGQFSRVGDLLRDALREMGDSNPEVVLTVDSRRYMNYANRVIFDVNSHPYFVDLMRNRFDDMTCDMVAGQNVLTNVTVSSSLLTNTPVRIVGAGPNGGDLYTTVVGSVSNGIEVADPADSSVSDAPLVSPYKSRIGRVSNQTDIRPIDDLVFINGIKFYATMDDADNGPTNAQAASLYSSGYYLSLIHI